MTKTCFKCNEVKPLDDFYAHPWMKDGRLNKCKECNKKDVQANYARRREQYSQYDKSRQLTAERRKKKISYTASHRKRNPEKTKARRAVAYHLSVGNIQKSPCITCGTMNNLHAHHDDYSKPLDVKWYCDKHHRIVEHGKQA